MPSGFLGHVRFYFPTLKNPVDLVRWIFIALKFLSLAPTAFSSGNLWIFFLGEQNIQARISGIPEHPGKTNELLENSQHPHPMAVIE